MIHLSYWRMDIEETNLFLERHLYTRAPLKTIT
jgi:hypothetical protein